MSWLDAHSESEILATRAEAAARSGDLSAAESLYSRAADSEVRAFQLVEKSKPRTLGILAVSGGALLFKARRFGDAEQFILEALNRAELPNSARFPLRQLIQDVWVEQDKKDAVVDFLPGQAQVSIRGGQILYGGAPLDLIVEKVKGIQSLFYRTIEYVRGDPLRKRGAPSFEIIEACRPWLIQAPPGSYQFSVAVQKPRQSDFFKVEIDADHIVSTFLDILRAGANSEEAEMEALIPEPDYRAAFMKLARNLAPTGKLFDVMEVRAPGEHQGVLLGPEVRAQLGRRIKDQGGLAEAVEIEKIVGVLRALHLDKDWIEIAGSGDPIRVHGIRDALEDVVGPMVNRPVIVTATTTRKAGKRRLQFVDIEIDE